MPKYLNTKELHKEIIVCQNRGEFSGTLYKMCKKVIDSYSWNFNYFEPEVREDCKGFAMERCYKSYHNYDPDRGNAFTFVTQVIKSAFYFEFNRQMGIKKVKNKRTGGKLIDSKIETVRFSRLFEDGQNNII